MDSRIVAREIKNEIRPLLRDHGFSKFTTKTAWRTLPDQIHVVNFQSFNSYLAEGIGATTFSFSLNLGVYIRAIPMWHPVKGGDPSAQPQEYHCHFRHRLLKEIDQPILTRRDTWYVAPDGSNLLETIADARALIQREGFPWFDQFRSMEDVLARLLVENEAHPAPITKYMIGHIARSLGRTELAEPMIAEGERELAAIVAQASRKK